jgi:hypothetical protein
MSEKPQQQSPTARQKDSSGRNLDEFFDVIHVDGSFTKVIPRLRGPIRPIVGVPNKDADTMKRMAFDYAGLSAYNDCWSFEMGKRPIPFVSTDKRPLLVRQKFEKYIGAVFDILIPQMEPHIQTYNKISKVGYPVLSNPEDEEGNLIKMDVLNENFIPLDEGDISAYHDSFSTIGVRLQHEDPQKLRDFQFITDDGHIYEEEIDRRKYTREFPQLGEVIPSRTRTVVNPALINLYLQVWDTMLHRAIMKHPLCESNVYNRVTWPADSPFVSFDCKHYERYLGMLVFPYAAAVGGRYGAWLVKLATDPYLVPSDTRKTNWLLKPRYSETVFPQFGSGLCCVSTLGKLGNICVQVGYFIDVEGLTVRDAVMAVLSGEHNGLRRWMYGDDNRTLGSKEKSDKFLAYMGEHFVIEVDDRARYLGTLWRPDIGRFLLPADTFNLKFYLRERDWTFSTYPHLGMVERRKTFTEYGEPEIGTTIIPHQDQLFNYVGHPFFEIIAAAVKERREANSSGILISKLAVTDKEYLMTPEEQLASGSFWGLPAERTRDIVIKLVSPQVKERFRFI